MSISSRQIIISAVAFIIAIAIAILVSKSSVRLGSEPLIVRGIISGLGIMAVLIGLYPFSPLFADRPGAYSAVVCLPIFGLTLLYYMYFLPSLSGEGMMVEQLRSELITDSSSNGIIEIGFSYPIYTPTLLFTNHELFTRHINVFLRMIDDKGETAFFRAVRSQVPGTGLTVEATVQGMLSETDGFQFNPVALPPNQSVEGKVVFVISNLENGETFTQALEQASQAQLEIRDPETGDLLLEFPVTRM